MATINNAVPRGAMSAEPAEPTEPADPVALAGPVRRHLSETTPDRPAAAALPWYASAQASLQQRMRKNRMSAPAAVPVLSAPSAATSAAAAAAADAGLSEKAAGKRREPLPPPPPLGPFILITGPPAVGKSTVARETARLVAEHLCRQDAIRATRRANGHDLEAEAEADAAEREEMRMRRSSDDSKEKAGDKEDKVDKVDKVDKAKTESEPKTNEEPSAARGVFSRITRRHKNKTAKAPEPRAPTPPPKAEQRDEPASNDEPPTPVRRIMARRPGRLIRRDWWAADRFDTEQPHAGPSSVSRVPGLVPPESPEERFLGGRVVVVHVSDLVADLVASQADANNGGDNHGDNHEPAFVTGILAAAPPPRLHLWRKLTAAASSAATPAAAAAAADDNNDAALGRDRGKKTKRYLLQLARVRAAVLARYLPARGSAGGSGIDNTLDRTPPHAVIVADCLAYRGHAGTTATTQYARAAAAAGRRFVPVYLACDEFEHVRRFHSRARDAAATTAPATVAAQAAVAEPDPLHRARLAVQRLAAAEARARKKMGRFQPPDERKVRKAKKAAAKEARRRSSAAAAAANSKDGKDGKDEKRKSSAASAASSALASIRSLYSVPLAAVQPTSSSAVVSSSSPSSSSPSVSPLPSSSPASASASPAVPASASSSPGPAPPVLPSTQPPLSLPVPRCVPGVESLGEHVELYYQTLYDAAGEHAQRPPVVSLPAPGPLEPFGGCMINTSRLTASEAAAQVVDFVQSTLRGEPSAAWLAARREVAEKEEPTKKPAVELHVG